MDETREKNYNKYIQEIISIVKKEKLSKEKLVKLKVKLCEKYKIREVPTDIEIFLNADNEDVPKIKKILQTKPARTLSGVAPVAIMTKPRLCSHGKCIYCPGGPGSYFGNIPQSYTGKEPATMRGIRNKFDSYLQVFNRLEQFVVLGNIPQKIEIIIMGGTFLSFPKKYKEKFVNDTFQAMNDFSDIFFDKDGFDYIKFKEFFELPGEVGSVERIKNIHKKLMRLKKERKKSLKGLKHLKQNQNYNDKKSNVKCVGLTIETNPSYGMLEHANEMLEYGCTRVEIGVQSVYPDIVKLINRSHSSEDTIKSIQILKDLGFKLNFHYMPGLPDKDGKRLSLKKDFEGLKKLFSDPNYRPDMLKIYPCMVMPGTDLEKLYKKKLFKPLTTKEAVKLIGEFKRFVPPYCRIMRVNRDIPTKQTIAGVDKTNLRQMIDEYRKQNEIVCRCIRCREVGRKQTDKKSKKQNKPKPKLKIYEYYASGEKEFFISIEDNNKKLYGFARLRFPFQTFKSRAEITEKSALIRELHVYGEAVGFNPTQNKSTQHAQHKGYGQILIKKAEQIAKKHKKNKMIVISGIGVRDYYRKKLGYKLEGVYMVKGI